MWKRNRYLRAFTEPLHLLIFAIGVALPLASGQILLLLLIGALEFSYLVYVPPTTWYARRLRQREEAVVRRQREASKVKILPSLCPAMRERYKRLETMHRQALEQTRDAHRWFADTPRKFDYLLDTFLEFASTQSSFLNYLAFVQEEVCGSSPARSKEFNPFRTNSPLDPDGPWVEEALSDIRGKYAGELETLRERLDRGEDEANTALLTKHAQILTRRAEFIEKLAQTLDNISRQLHVLEDSFGLINDVMQARKPEEAILADIDDAVAQTDAMANVLKEMSDSEQIIRSLDRIQVKF